VASVAIIVACDGSRRAVCRGMVQKDRLVGTLAIKLGTKQALEIDPQIEVVDKALRIDTGFCR
jgi:hypothetical protein